MTDHLEKYRRQIEQHTGEAIPRPRASHLVIHDTDNIPMSAEQMAQDNTMEAASQIAGAGEHFTWPWPSIEELVGPLVPSRLYVLGGRPSNGKSSLMLALAGAMLEHGVLYLGTEMPPSQLLLKWACARLGVDERYLARNCWDELADIEKQEIQDEVSSLANQAMVPSCHVIDTNSLQEWIQWGMDQATLPRVVFLDHLHRLKPLKGQDRFTAIDAAISLCKDLAIQLGVVMVVASQLSRTPRDPFELYRPPQMSMFKGASAIEENADVAMGSFRVLTQTVSAKDERAIRSDQRNITEFAARHRIAVNAVKLRLMGDNNGKAVRLGFYHGRVWDLSAGQEDIPF